MSYRRHNINYHGNNDFVGCLIGMFLTMNNLHPNEPSAA